MFTLLDALRLRELNGSPTQLQLSLNKLFDENIINNNAYNRLIPAMGQVVSMHCCGDFLAILDSSGTLSLYNILNFRKCWSIQVVPHQDYVFFIDSVFVSDSGVVLLKSVRNFIWDYGHGGLHLQVFNKGKQISGFTITTDYYFFYSSIQFVNDRIFGTARSGPPIYFFEWDTLGTELCKIEINDVFSAIDIIGTSVSEDSCILYPRIHNSRDRSDKTLAVFIFNLTDSTYRSLAFKLNESEPYEAREPDSIIRFNDTFIVTFHYVRPHGGNLSRDPRSAKTSRLYIFDAVTGIDLGMPDLGELNGMIRTIIVKSNLIVLVISTGTRPDVVKCLEFKGNRLVMRHIKEIPFVFNSTPLLCFNDSKLSIAYQANGTSNWCLFDLDSLEMVQEIEGLGHPDMLPIYSNHQLIIPKLDGVAIYDYRHTNTVNNMVCESKRQGYLGLLTI